MKYYHNPRCSKSRQGLTYLSSNVEIILYLKEHLSASVYVSILERYDGDVLKLLRTQEPPAKGRNLGSYNIDELGEFLSQNPIVLQRPILDDGESIIVGRPVEKIQKYLDN